MKLARLALLGTVLGAAIVVPGTASAANPRMFLAVLNAAQETPPVASTAIGNALLTFDNATSMLCFSIGFQGVTSAELFSHIHGPALPGAPAPVIFFLPTGNPKSGCVGPLTKQQKADLNRNLLYINIHSTDFSAGEIRGQIVKQ
jgi:hypothetical protein